MSAPKNYSSIEEFEREELRRDFKMGFSLDDLVSEAALERRATNFDQEDELVFGDSNRHYR